MLPHPEGGWYKETYRSKGIIPFMGAAAGFIGDRNISTAIYFLLKSENFSGFHRIKSDELWHFYTGGPLNVYVIDKAGTLSIIRLGNNMERGEVFQAVVEAGCWFASQPAEENSFTLVGCTVAPGFDFQDFELAKKDELAALYPQHRTLIEKYCRQ